MSRYSKAAREAFKAERERQHIYWMELVEHSFRKTFSWTSDILNSKYRRSPSTSNIKKPILP